MRIAQASSSENFTNYGTAPNQRRTGVTASNPGGNMDGELNVVPWYGPWEKVYRPVDNVIAEKVATFMYNAVANGSHIGYSWSGNTGVFDALKALGSTNPADIKTLVNCDCATLVGAAIYYAGIHESKLRVMVTWKMDEILMGTHAFTVLTGEDLCKNGVGIRRGDILWKTGHTAVALDDDATDDLFVFERFNFYGVSIPIGTIGTRAAQKSKVISKPGFRPVVARLTYVSDSSLANVVPFFGNGDGDKTLHVNFYRATKTACKVDAGVIVVYVRDDAVR